MQNVGSWCTFIEHNTRLTFPIPPLSRAIIITVPGIYAKLNQVLVEPKFSVAGFSNSGIFFLKVLFQM